MNRFRSIALVIATTALALIVGALIVPYAVGAPGPTHLAQEDGTWHIVSSPTTYTLSSVAMVSENEGWIVGGISTGWESSVPVVLHYTWGSWQEYPSPVDRSLSSVVMNSTGTEGWAVGGDLGRCVSMHYTGGIWHEVPCPNDNYLESVSMSPTGDVWAVGGRGTILHSTGDEWRVVASPTIEQLMGVWTVNANESWAVGAYERVLHYTDGAWQQVSSSSSWNALRSITMLNANEGWLVGYSGTIKHYAGGSWQPVPSPTTSILHSVRMVDADEGWAVGVFGTILRYTGGSWQSFSSHTSESLMDVSMVDAYDGWAVGSNGTILHYTAPRPATAISGQVVDRDGSPVASVSISDGAGHGVITDGNGDYVFSDLQAGTYTLTPSKAGCLFTPATRMVSVPPDALGQDFEAHCDFRISGQVLDGSRNPFAGVQISAGGGYTTTTDAGGRYVLTELLSGTYTLTPTLTGYAFQPSARTVSVPPDAAGRDFAILPVPVSVTLPLSGTANLPANLTYTDTQGLATTLRFPTGVVTKVTTLVLTPTLAQGDAGFAFVGHAFEIRAYQDGHPLAGFVFNRPVTISIRYSGQDVRVVSDESQLVLQHWTGNGWEDAACGAYDRRPSQNWLSVPICHLSRFALFGRQYRVYIPLALRNS